MAQSNAVIDLSHHDTVQSFAKAKQDGIVAVIHKATQGTGFVDPTYQQHRKAVEAEGLLWGAYHFGTAADGVFQAEHFLDVVNPDANTLLVLDFEDNPTGPSMTLEEARAFVTHVREKTNRFPGFYSGHTIKRVLGSGTDPILANCWFWLAQYSDTAVVPPNWKTWTMWQYTDGAQGPAPHTVQGIGRCDRDKFTGTVEDLKAFWTLAT